MIGIINVSIASTKQYQTKDEKMVTTAYKNSLNRTFTSKLFWSMDFMSDTLWYGKRYHLLNIMDECNPELLDVTVDTSLPAHRVIETLDRLIAYRGTPHFIRVDNGHELISTHLELW